MKFVISMLNDFQISRITYDDGITCYWVLTGNESKHHVDGNDPVGEILDSCYGRDFHYDYYFPTTGNGFHFASDIIIFDQTRGRVVLQQHLSWAEQGVSNSLFVIRHRPGMFKPASAA